MRPFPVVPFASLLAFSILLAGCNQTEIVSSSAPSSQPGAHLHGVVHGGQPVVTGAHIYIFAAGTSGYGGASNNLMTSGFTGTDSLGNYVTTDGSGAWAVTGDYTCTSGTQVYILATQGNPGLGTGGNNPNLALMAALGQCPTSGSLDGPDPYVVINEVTTVASVYALSGFMTDLSHVSSASSTQSLVGIANAFANVRSLVNIATGVANANTVKSDGTTNLNGTVPQSTINTLANIISACIDTGGGLEGDGSTCGTLFLKAPNGSTYPKDTVTAALNIAHNPSANISTLYGLGVANSPFAPSLTGAPNDFTVSLTFTDSSLNAPDAIAIDAAGDAWVTNSGASSVTKFSPLGVGSSFTAGGITSPDGIAIDTSNNVWISNNTTPGTVSEINSSGTAVGSSPFSGTFGSGHTFQPRGIGFDASGNAWVGNFGSGESGTVFEFNSSGSQISTSNGYSPPFGIGIITGVAVASDPIGGSPGFPMALDLYEGGIDGFTDSGTVLSPTGGWDAGINSPEGIAVDNSGSVWIANHGSSALKLTFTYSGTPRVPTSETPHSYTGGGVQYGQAVAIDGAGNAWIANTSESTTPGRLSEFSNSGTALTPSTGYTTSNASSLLNPMAIAIDPSGDVWTCNSYTNFSTDVSTYTLTEFLGAATPVVTPLAAGVANNTLGTEP